MAGELGRQAPVVRCEEAEAADVRRNVMQDCFGDGNAVVGGGAAPEFVEDDERAGRCFGEDLFRFGQLDKEGRLSAEDVVVRT